MAPVQVRFTIWARGFPVGPRMPRRFRRGSGRSVPYSRDSGSVIVLFLRNFDALTIAHSSIEFIAATLTHEAASKGNVGQAYLEPQNAQHVRSNNRTDLDPDLARDRSRCRNYGLPCLAVTKIKPLRTRISGNSRARRYVPRGYPRARAIHN